MNNEPWGANGQISQVRGRSILLSEIAGVFPSNLRFSVILLHRPMLIPSRISTIANNRPLCSTDYCFTFDASVECSMVIGLWFLTDGGMFFFQWASWRAALHRISRLYNESRNRRLEVLNFGYERTYIAYILQCAGLLK